MLIIKLPNEYAQTHRKQLKQLISSWSEFRSSNDIKKLKPFYVYCNTVAQEVATFSLPALQQILSTMLLACEQYQAQKISEQTLISEVDWFISQLIKGNAQTPNPFLEEKDIKDEQALMREIAEHASLVNRIGKPRIVIIDDQKSVTSALKAVLEDFSFNVECSHSIDEFKNSYDIKQVDLVLLDVVMPNVSTEEVFDFAKYLVERGTKVISCSSLFTFDVRLLAVRARVNDYIVKPVNTYLLVEKIGRALGLQIKRNYHVVVVDDQKVMGTYYTEIFEKQGFSISYFPTAKSLFHKLDDLSPDMFLLDINMPDVHGFEMARMIRQEHKFDFAPILFITADETLETRIEAINAGADDVILKSAPIQSVIQQIDTRLNRASVVQAFVAKDPLTGVLNHGQIVEAANQSIRINQRRNTASAIAVIDVDHFKSVNDKYGHITGDKVLAAFGQLLQNSVRETDSVGRYGGEEFVIVFQDCSVNDACIKVQRIKDTFHKMAFQSKEGAFSVSFSGGVTELQRFDNVQAAISIADQALYKAKTNGRNKIVKYTLKPME